MEVAYLSNNNKQKGKQQPINQDRASGRKLSNREKRVMNALAVRWPNAQMRLTCLKTFKDYEELSACTDIDNLYQKISATFDSVCDVYGLERDVDHLLVEMLQIELCLCTTGEKPFTKPKDNNANQQMVNYMDRLNGIRELAEIQELVVAPFTLNFGTEYATLKIHYGEEDDPWLQALEDMRYRDGRKIYYQIGCSREVRQIMDEITRKAILMAE